MAGTETLNSKGVSSEIFQTTTPVFLPETKDSAGNMVRSRSRREESLAYFMKSLNMSMS